jgi:hypothetical protein
MIVRALVCAIVVVFGVALSPAYAGDVECSLWSSGVSRSLFNNSGGYATTGAAFLASPECAHTPIGVYGNLFLSAPIADFETGAEIDGRVGMRRTFGHISTDVSVAWYYFGVGHDTWLNTGDARARIAYTFDSVNNITISPYAGVDAQRSFTMYDNAFAVFGGTTVSWTFPNAPGKPTFSADAAVWSYTTSFGPNKGPIWSLSAQIGFEVAPNVIIGPRALWAWGGTGDDERFKDMYGIFAVMKF